MISYALARNIFEIYKSSKDLHNLIDVLIIAGFLNTEFF